MQLNDPRYTDNHHHFDNRCLAKMPAAQRLFLICRKRLDLQLAVL